MNKIFLQNGNIESLFRIATSYLNTVKSVRKENDEYKEVQKKDAKDVEQSNKKAKNEKKANDNQNQAPQPAKDKNPVNTSDKYAAQNKERQYRIL